MPNAAVRDLCSVLTKWRRPQQTTGPFYLFASSTSHTRLFHVFGGNNLDFNSLLRLDNRQPLAKHSFFFFVFWLKRKCHNSEFYLLQFHPLTNSQSFPFTEKKKDLLSILNFKVWLSFIQDVQNHHINGIVPGHFEFIFVSFLLCCLVFFSCFFFFQLTTLVRSFSTCSLVYRQASSFISLFFLTSSACLSCQTNTVACLWIRWDWWGRNGKVKNALEKIRRWGRNQCSFLLQVSEGLPGLLGSVLNVNTDWSLIDRVTTGNLHTFS